MDNTYIVTVQTTQEANRVEHVLNGFKGWIKIMNNVYAVKTDGGVSPADVRDAIVNGTDTETLVFVIRSGINAAWREDTNCSEWLKTNL